MDEIWKTVPECERYEVSNLGNVRSVDRTTADGRKVKGRNIKPIPREDGYLQISRYIGDGRQKIELVHRLVAAAFLGLPPEGCVVDHIDRNRTNNAVENLRYLPKAENDSQSRDKLGKAVKQYNIEGELVKMYLSVKDASRQTNIDNGDISRACNGKRKNAGGYFWRYA